MGDIGTSYIASWVGETVTLGAAVSAFACCLACVVGASRLLYAVARDASPGSALSRTGRNDTPAAPAVVVSVVIALIALVCAVFFGADAVRHLPVERHHRHADPARRLRAGHRSAASSCCSSTAR